LIAIAEPAGAAVKITVGCTVLEAVVEVEKRTVCSTAVPSAPATGALSVVTVMLETYEVWSAALATVTDESAPKPNAATATSAMRLKVVFVDICFLSISRTKEFPQFGLNQISLIRFDESHVLIHQIPHRVSGRGEETYLFVCHLHCLR